MRGGGSGDGSSGDSGGGDGARKLLRSSERTGRII